MIGWRRERAVLNGPEVVRRLQHPFGKQEAGGQFSIGSRCSHDDGERPAVESNLERLLGRGAIDPPREAAGQDAHHFHLLDWGHHWAILPPAPLLVAHCHTLAEARRTGMSKRARRTSGTLELISESVTKWSGSTGAFLAAAGIILGWAAIVLMGAAAVRMFIPD